MRGLTRVLRWFYRRYRRVQLWIQNILDLLDWADWKTWLWYSLLGLDKLSRTLIVWAKRRGYQPGVLKLKRGKFYVVPQKRKVS